MSGPRVSRYRRFANRIEEEALWARRPIGGSIELTFRCNYRCAHCYNRLPAGDRGAIEGELDARRWIRVLDDLQASGTLWLLLTGGEPLLHPDFRKIYLAALERGFLVGLYTNGSLVTPDLAKWFAEHPPFRIEVTLYGASDPVSDRVTQARRSFSRSLRGLDLLLARDIPARTKMTLVRGNVADLPAVKRIARARGVGRVFRSDPDIQPRIDRDPAPMAHRLPPEVAARLEAPRPDHLFPDRPVPAPAAGDPLFRCAAGRTLFNVDPYGRMGMCLMLREPSFDVATRRFPRAWREMVRVRDGMDSISDVCRGCLARDACTHCPAWSWLETGRIDRRALTSCRTGIVSAVEAGLVPPSYEPPPEECA